MSVLGHGIDLVETDRIRRLIDEHGDRALERLFTEGERAHGADSPRRAEHLAARYAAKEAVLKALGTGWTQGIAWTDVEVWRSPSGQPEIRLHGRAAEIAASMGVGRWLVSLTHTAGHAAASVIALESG